jgi:hypothetical protein
MRDRRGPSQQPRSSAVSASRRSSWQLRSPAPHWPASQARPGRSHSATGATSHPPRGGPRPGVHRSSRRSARPDPRSGSRPARVPPAPPYAIERARLLSAEQSARRHAEAAQQRLALLAETAAHLGDSLDYDATIQRAADVMIPVLADVCIVFTIEGQQATPRAVAVAHADSTDRERLRAVGHLAVPANAGRASGSEMVRRTRPRPDDAMRAASSKLPSRLRETGDSITKMPGTKASPCTSIMERQQRGTYQVQQDQARAAEEQEPPCPLTRQDLAGPRRHDPAT